MLKAYQDIKALHKVVTSNYENINDLLESYLKIGCEIFDLQLGIASFIENEQYAVLSVTENSFGIEPKAVFPLEGTYCEKVFNKEKTISVHEAGKDPDFNLHPAYKNLKLESYISTPVYLNGKIYGTLNFSSPSPKKEPFRDYDHEIIELMAESFSAFLKKKYDQEQCDIHQASLYASAKLSSLGEMAGGIAHEINNPMTIISGSTEKLLIFLKNNPDLAHEKIVKPLNKIETTVERVTKIIRGMQELLKNDNEEQEKDISISSVLESTVALTCQTMKNSEIELILNENTKGTVQGNSTQISQVFMNLLNNAIDAAKNAQKRWIKIETQERKDHLIFKISNSGEGISSENIDKVFDPFFTTKPPGKGTGLGLSITQKILNQYGGSIEVASDENETCFTVCFKKS